MSTSSAIWVAAIVLTTVSVGVSGYILDRRMRARLLGRTNWSVDEFRESLGFPQSSAVDGGIRLTLGVFERVLRVPASKLRPDDRLRELYGSVLDVLLLDSAPDVAIERIASMLKRNCGRYPTFAKPPVCLRDVVEATINCLSPGAGASNEVASGNNSLPR